MTAARRIHFASGTRLNLNALQRLRRGGGVEAEEAPGRQHMARERGGGGDDAAPGPRQAYAAGVEMQALGQVDTGEKGLPPAIFAVAQDRRAHGGAMDAQLM